MKSRRSAWLTFVLVVLVSPASADLGDALDGMYMVTGNEASIYQSQRRLGVDAGYLRFRAPISTYNIVNFSPPRFDAGCGGLDLYGGSFSFINAEQFRQMLRQIGANALGYAFKLALSSICQDCDAQLTQLFNDMAEKMQMQVDTCKWGAGLAIGTAEGLGFSIDEKYKADATGAGSFSDTMEAFTSLFSDDGFSTNAGNVEGYDPNNLLTGNHTWNALNHTGAAARFQFPSGNISNIDLLLNIAGTFMNTDIPADANDGAVEEFKTQRLTYKEFKVGKTPSGTDANDASSLVTCAGTACTDYNYVAQWSFTGGVQTYVAANLQAAADHMADPGTANTEHTAEIQAFIGSLPFPVMTHMMELQGNGPALNQYVQVMTPIVTNIYAPALATQLTDMVRTAYDDSETPDITDQVKENLDKFEAGATEDFQNFYEEYSDELLKIEAFVALHSSRSRDLGIRLN